MPEEIEKILELAGPPAAQPAGGPTVSKSARISRTCGLLALGSVILFWLMMGLFGSAEEAGGKNARDLSANLLVFEICFLACLSIAVAITAIMGLVGAKRHPGNCKVIVWALVLTVLAVAGFIVPLLVILSHCRFSL
jgi:hypothetical protein